MADQVKEFVPAEASAEDWARYHRFRRRWHEASYPEDPYTPDEIEQAEMLKPDSFSIRRRFGRVRDGEVVSALVLSATPPSSPEYETNKHLVGLTWFTVPEERRQGLAAAWISKAVELTDGLGCTVASMWTHEESGHAFLRWLGAEPRYAERESRLDLRTLDWDLVDRWVTEGQERSPQARMELYPHRLPEAQLPELAESQTRLLNLMPWEDLDHGDIIFTPEMYREWSARLDTMGADHHTVLVREADGTVSALTDVVKKPYETGYVRQYFTGVDPPVRGRGLGKWVKAAMLQYIRETHPETVFITTENAGSNAAMLAINHGLGFRLYREATTYQMGRDALASKAR